MALIAARVMGGVFVVLSLFVLVMTWGSYQRDQRIVREGLHAEGTVVKKEFLAASDDSDFVLVYAFTPVGGTERLEHRRHISEQLWKRLKVGDRIQVLHGPSDPRRSFPEGHGITTFGLALFFSFVAVCLLGMGSVVLFARAVPNASQEP
jgi:Na+-transporting methylmalonyl-CoA/oxaloacetate decarboxylase gamma subunit